LYNLVFGKKSYLYTSFVLYEIIKLKKKTDKYE